jgi:hypothetical protein
MTIRSQLRADYEVMVGQLQSELTAAADTTTRLISEKTQMKSEIEELQLFYSTKINELMADVQRISKEAQQERQIFIDEIARLNDVVKACQCGTLKAELNALKTKNTDDRHKLMAENSALRDQHRIVVKANDEQEYALNEAKLQLQNATFEVQRQEKLLQSRDTRIQELQALLDSSRQQLMNNEAKFDRQFDEMKIILQQERLERFDDRNKLLPADQRAG